MHGQGREAWTLELVQKRCLHVRPKNPSWKHWIQRNRAPLVLHPSLLWHTSCLSSPFPPFSQPPPIPFSVLCHSAVCSYHHAMKNVCLSGASTVIQAVTLQRGSQACFMARLWHPATSMAPHWALRIGFWSKCFFIPKLWKLMFLKRELKGLICSFQRTEIHTAILDTLSLDEASLNEMPFWVYSVTKPHLIIIYL